MAMTLDRKGRLAAARKRCAVGTARRLAFGLALAVGTLAAAPAAAQNGAVVTYAGALDQDGCPDCCRFSCRATPTPTPEFDGMGRRVFQRSSGRFLFVVESAPGASLRAPSVAGTRSGESIEPLGAFARPALQLRFGNALGDGNPAVECGTTLVGGIPAAVGLDEAQLTTAMIDAACRFEWVPAGQPCTRSRTGDFATVDGDTVVQYCFQVPEGAKFPAGDTVVTMQVRDTAGNLGPPEEIVVRVGTAAPTPTPTVAGSGPFAVSGLVGHYGAGAPVADVVLDETSSGRSAASDAAGTFVLAGLEAGEVEIVPRKHGGVGRAVSPLDAAYVLQATSQMRELTALQRLACDVTGDGTLSNLDATRILQWTVGAIAGLPVAAPGLCGSDWAFFPFATAAPQQTLVVPSLAGGVCRPGAIRYDPLSAAAANQSFLALPFGDCTANWPAGSGAATTAASAPSPTRGGVRLGRLRRGRGGRIEVPLHVTSGEPVAAAYVEIAYDPEAVVARRSRRGGPVAGAVLVENRTQPGVVRLALAARGATVGDGPLALLRFRAHPQERRADPRLRVVRAIVESAG